MLRKTLTQMKELEFGSLVSNKYFKLLGVEDFYIGNEIEDLVAGLQFLVEKSVRQNGLAELLRRNRKVHKVLNKFLNNHNFLTSNCTALIYANRVDQLWLSVRKNIETYSSEYKSQMKCDEEKNFISELNNLALPE